MLIDCHTHVLGFGDPKFTTVFMRQMLTCVYRTKGQLPVYRLPTDEDWRKTSYKDEPVDPKKLLYDLRDFDRIVILAWSPHRWPEGLQGTIDLSGVTDVPGPATPEKCNDYIAALVRRYPEKFLGFASVNPVFKGPKDAAEEIERAVYKLGLMGVKLYPTYQGWSPADQDIAFPIFEKAEVLDIPVMIHMAGSSAIETPLELSRPLLLDIIGRKFRRLKVIISHMGIPWEKEALFLLQKHPNFYGDLSYFNGTIDRESLYRFLISCKHYFVPLEKLFFGSDYPIYNPIELIRMLKSVNEEAEILNKPRISEKEIDGILGKNFGRFLGL